ncbi:hypothetical protein HYC85_028884 [Camellia sinensis]|uniref:Uncharacterized protein n=1 Tax=Camellia sinensis TaxID=4442 RepID=A0A7J7FWE9_CAMSI|nr:hypothetical protein HYC85_028884 [Camellia sinensis]
MLSLLHSMARAHVFNEVIIMHRTPNFFAAEHIVSPSANSSFCYQTQADTYARESEMEDADDTSNSDNDGVAFEIDLKEAEMQCCYF